jgi:TonB-dependent starch-binding outer membrane protein SusC
MLVYSEEYWFERRQGSSRTDRIHPILHEIDAALQDNPSASGGSSTEGLRSYIGRVNYIAFDKYLLEANFRYDGSSKFLYPHQYSIFPSASIGWIFSRENFMANVSEQLLTTGKFRMSYGGLGNNSGVGRYEQQETLTSTPYVWGGNIVRGFVNQKMINLDLTWESTYVFNFGIDLGFLRNRLTTEIDFYDRKTINMLRPSEMSMFLTGAYSAPRRNIGEMRNRGVEINLTWRERIGELRYSINLLAAHNQNRLEKWNEYLGRGTTFINMPLNFLYNYEDIGIAQSWFDIYNATPQGLQPGDIIRLDLNGDGRIDGNDRRAYPKYNTRRPPTDFGLNSHFAWKGIDMSILLQGTSGRKAYWLTQYNRLSFAGTRRYATSWDHWTLPWSWENRNGEWPRLGANNSENNQTFWLDDMSFIRLKNLQFGYTVPNKGLNRIGIDNIRIYGTAENLLTFTQWRGLDPEKELSETHAYPLVKSFSFGINLGI